MKNSFLYMILFALICVCGFYWHNNYRLQTYYKLELYTAFSSMKNEDVVQKKDTYLLQ